MEAKTKIRNFVPVLVNKKTGEKIPLLKNELIIGRVDDCDIIINEPTISKQHSKILIQNNIVIIKDLNSTNGTFVNGERIIEKQLRNNDIIRFDVFEFQILITNIDETKTAVHSSIQYDEGGEKKTKILKTEEINYGIFTVLNGTHKDEKFFMKTVELIIGREKGDIIISDDIVSGKHCKIEFKNNKFFIQDLNSSNHTYINDEEITKSELKDNDIIKLGNIEMKFNDLITKKIQEQGTQQIDESVIQSELLEIKKKKIKKIRAIATILGLLIAAGIGWLITSYQKENAPVKSVKLNKILRFFTKQKVSAKPLLVKDNNLKLFVASEDKNLYTIDVNTMEAVSIFNNKNKFKSDLKLINTDDEKIIAVDRIGKVFVFNKDGKLIFNTPDGFIKGKVISAPKLVDLNKDGVDDIVIGTEGKFVYALNGVSLEKIWKTPVEGKIISRVVSADVNSDGIKDIFVNCKNGALYCLNGKNGNSMWNIKINQIILTSAAKLDFNLDSVSDFVVSTKEGQIIVFNGINGNVLARMGVNMAIVASPVIADMNNDDIEDIVVGTKNGYLIVINGKDGSILNKINTDTNDEIIDNIILMDITFDKIPDIIFGSRNSYVYIVNGRKGNIISQATAGSGITSRFVVADIDGNGYPEFICGTRSGEMSIFTIETVPGKNFGKNKIFFNSDDCNAQ